MFIMRKLLILLFTLCWLPFVFALQGFAQQALTELVTEKELRTNVEQWRIATESYYLAWYQKPLSIGIEKEASTFLVNEYVKRKLPTVFSDNKDIGRLVIKRDIGVVLSRSLNDSIKARYGTLARFILAVENQVSITLKNIQAALQAEDCNVIPCPPDKCKPDCSSNSFKRFTQ